MVWTQFLVHEPKTPLGKRAVWLAPVYEAEAVLDADGARHPQLIRGGHHLAHPKRGLVGQAPVPDFALCNKRRGRDGT